MSTEYLGTKYMSTEYLGTKYMSTEYIAGVSTEYLEGVSTEYLEGVSTEYFHIRLRLRRKGRVTLLPQELAGAEKGCGLLELPADHVVPLVQLGGQRVRVSGNTVGRGTGG